MSDPRRMLAELEGHVIDRRRFLAFMGALAGTAAYSQLRGDLASAAPPLPGYPFSLGVASGDPAPDGVVLWTRLVPEPLVKTGGMPAHDVAVRWEVATDDGFANVVRSGTVAALPELAHSVHVEVTGLEPWREYYYRFLSGSDSSPVGRTKTAPARGQSIEEMRFAFASCQAWPDGYYSAYRRMLEEDLDYPGQRARVLQHIADAGVANPVVVTGDWHSTFVHDLKVDFDDEHAPTVATEFVGTSISSNGDGEVYGPYYGPMVQFNPNIRYFDGDRRGYVRCTLDHEKWTTDLRMVSTVSSPDAAIETLASFVVEDGQPGVVEPV